VRVLLTYIVSDREPRTAAMPRCLQNLACLKYECSTNEPPLYIWRRMLSIQYSLRLRSSPSNPAYNTGFSPKVKASFSSKPNQISALGIRISPKFEQIGFKRNIVSWLSVLATPTWLLRHPAYILPIKPSLLLRFF